LHEIVKQKRKTKLKMHKRINQLLI